MTSSPVLRQKLRRAALLLSLLLFPVTMNYLSPYLIIDGAAQGVAAGSMITFGLMFLGSLFLGRLWCAWACPAGGLMEYAFAVNDRHVNLRPLNILRWAIWGLWMGGLVFAAVSAGGLTRVNLLHMMDTPISVDAPFRYIIYYTVIFLFLGVSLAVGRRAGCHSFCWMAPFMILGRKLRNLANTPALRLQANPQACVECHKCTRGCPMSLDVTSMVRSGKMEHSECMLCGNCIDTCASHAIRYTFSSGK